MTRNNGYTRKLVLTAIIIIFAFGSMSAQAAVQKQATSKTLRSMARAYLAFGKYDKAQVFAKKALDKANTQHADIAERALCMIDLATVYSYQDRLSESEKMFTQGIQLQKQALFADHPYVAHGMKMLSEVYRRQGDYARAEQTLNQATHIMLSHTTAQSKEMAPFILESAKLQMETGRFDASEENYQKALKLYKASYGNNHLMTANVMESISQLYLNQGKLDQADQFISQTLKTKTHIFGRYHPVLIDSWLTKARICRMRGDFDKSEYYITKVTGTIAESRNAVTTARVYEQVNQIRTQGLVAAVVTTN